MVFTLKSRLLKCEADSPAVRNKLVYYCINRPHSHFRGREESAEKLPLTTDCTPECFYNPTSLELEEGPNEMACYTLCLCLSRTDTHTYTQTDESLGTDISPPQISLCLSFSLCFFIAAMYSPNFCLNRQARGTEREWGCHSNMPTRH